jgi:hypothetical protein
MQHLCSIWDDHTTTHQRVPWCVCLLGRASSPVDVQEPSRPAPTPSAALPQTQPTGSPYGLSLAYEEDDDDVGACRDTEPNAQPDPRSSFDTLERLPFPFYWWLKVLFKMITGCRCVCWLLCRLLAPGVTCTCHAGGISVTPAVHTHWPSADASGAGRDRWPGVTSGLGQCILAGSAGLVLLVSARVCMAPAVRARCPPWGESPCRITPSRCLSADP